MSMGETERERKGNFFFNTFSIIFLSMGRRVNMCKYMNEGFFPLILQMLMFTLLLMCTVLSFNNSSWNERIFQILLLFKDKWLGKFTCFYGYLIERQLSSLIEQSRKSTGLSLSVFLESSESAAPYAYPIQDSTDDFSNPWNKYSNFQEGKRTFISFQCVDDEKILPKE